MNLKKIAIFLKDNSNIKNLLKIDLLLFKYNIFNCNKQLIVKTF